LVVLAGVLIAIPILSQSTAPGAPASPPGAFTLVQDTDPDGPDVAVLPAALGRLSWGAVLAGALVALIIELTLNLLGVAIGATSLNPRSGDGSASAQSVGTGAVVWIALSTIVALLVGGWIAARFAGIPDRLDGLLHGLIVWALVTLVSMLLLTSTIGRILSGVTTLLMQGVQLAGQAAGGVIRGAGNVASGVAQGAGNVVQGMAQGAANVAQGAASAAQDAAQSYPDMAQYTRQRDTAMQNILAEARRLMQQAGIDPNAVQGQVEQSGEEVKEAVQRVVQNPQEADHVLSSALTRILTRAQGVVNKADRDSVINVLAERGRMPREKAQEQLERWESSFDQVRQQSEQAMQQVRAQADQLGEKVRQVGEEAKDKVERAAEDVADTATKAIARAALAAFAAIIIGGIAAGIGGALGSPQELPEAEITADTSTSYHLWSQ
jgi:hypothetical protein